MTWQWVAVLVVVVFAWTVHKVTQMWQVVTMYRYSTDTMKEHLYEEYNKHAGHSQSD